MHVMFSKRKKKQNKQKKKTEKTKIKTRTNKYQNNKSVFMRGNLDSNKIVRLD